MLYKFRAECRDDVEELCQLLPTDKLIALEVTPDAEGGPDQEVKVELQDTTLEQLRALMWTVTDGHVMAQTVAVENEYTGVRDYNLAP